jgi:AcrR family transcriptional regulator
MLWAAVQLFSSRGVAATSTREIAAAAQTTERTLFKHFGSKDGLVRAVIEEAVLAHVTPTSLRGLTEAIAAFDGDLEAWHRSLLHARLRALSAAPEITRLLLGELLRDPLVRAAFGDQWAVAAWQPLVDLFTQLQLDGKVRGDVPAPVVARQFLSLNLGFLLSRVLLAPDLLWDDDQEIACLARVFASGIRPT